MFASRAFKPVLDELSRTSLVWELTLSCWTLRPRKGHPCMQRVRGFTVIRQLSKTAHPALNHLQGAWPDDDMLRGGDLMKTCCEVDGKT